MSRPSIIQRYREAERDLHLTKKKAMSKPEDKIYVVSCHSENCLHQLVIDRLYGLGYAGKFGNEFDNVEFSVNLGRKPLWEDKQEQEINHITIDEFLGLNDEALRPKRIQIGKMKIGEVFVENGYVGSGALQTYTLVVTSQSLSDHVVAYRDLDHKLITYDPTTSVQRAPDEVTTAFSSRKELLGLMQIAKDVSSATGGDLEETQELAIALMNRLKTK